MEPNRAILKNMRNSDELEKIRLLWGCTSRLRLQELRDISAKSELEEKENFLKFINRWPSYTLPLGKALVYFIFLLVLFYLIVFLYT